MAVSKPAKLVEDGVMGQKTRNAIAYLCGYPTTFAGGTGIDHSNFDKDVMKYWQRMLNGWVPLLPRWSEGGSYNCVTTVAQSIGNGGKLVVDGKWGSLTRRVHCGYVIKWTGGVYSNQLGLSCTNYNLNEYADAYHAGNLMLQKAMNRHMGY